jgi:selenocysteine-specific elongation factor
LEKLITGTPGEVLIQSISRLGPVPFNQAIQRAGLNWEEAQHAIEELRSLDDLILLEQKPQDPDSETLIMDRGTWRDIRNKIARILETYHRKKPLRSGIPREELKSRLLFDSRNFNTVLQFAKEEGAIIEDGPWIRSPQHQVNLSDTQQDLVNSLKDQFRAAPFSTPSVKECIDWVGGDLYAYLLETGEFIQVSPDVVFSKSAFERMVDAVRQALEEEGTITVAQVRDRFETSRKYALALMEHLDEIGVTVREGDSRRLSD